MTVIYEGGDSTGNKFAELDSCNGMYCWLNLSVLHCWAWYFTPALSGLPLLTLTEHISDNAWYYHIPDIIISLILSYPWYCHIQARCHHRNWGVMPPPPFSNFSVFSVLTPPPSNALTPHLQICDAPIGHIPYIITSLILFYPWNYHIPVIITSLILSHPWYCHIPDIITSQISHPWYCHIPDIITSLILSYPWNYHILDIFISLIILLSHPWCYHIPDIIISLILLYPWYYHIPDIIISLILLLSHPWCYHIPDNIISLILSYPWYYHIPYVIKSLILS